MLNELDKNFWLQRKQRLIDIDRCSMQNQLKWIAGCKLSGESYDVNRMPVRTEIQDENRS